MQSIKNFIEKVRIQKIKKLSNKINELMKTGFYGASMHHEFEFQQRKKN